MAGIRTTWTSGLGTTYDLTLDVDAQGLVIVTKAYRHRAGMQRARAPILEATRAPITKFPTLDPDTIARLATRMERTAR